MSRLALCSACKLLMLKSSEPQNRILSGSACLMAAAEVKERDWTRGLETSNERSGAGSLDSMAAAKREW